jgi:hypothetical protein
MFIATFVFWLGPRKYVNVPPAAAQPGLVHARRAHRAAGARAGGRRGRG